MKGSKGYLLTEVLVCLSAAAIVCASAAAAYGSGIKLLTKCNEQLAAFNAATGAYDDNELAEMGLIVERQEFYCSGLSVPFCYVTVKNAAGDTVAGLVTGSGQ